MRELLRRSYVANAIVASCFVGAAHVLVAALEPLVEIALFAVINFFGLRIFRGNVQGVFPNHYPWPYYATMGGLFTALALVGTGLLWWFFRPAQEVEN